MAAVHSNTADEPATIGAAVQYTRTGTLDLDILEHPPLLKYLVGASVWTLARDFPVGGHEGSSYRFGHRFLFHSSASPELILARARLPVLLLSAALAGLLALWAGRWYGPWGGALGAAMLALEPTWIGQSGVGGIDVALAFWLFAAAYCVARWSEDGRARWAAAAGALAGAASCTKLPGMVFFAWLAAWLSLLPRPAAPRRRLAPALAILTACFCLVVLLCYQVRFAGAFLEMFRYRFLQVFRPGAIEDFPVFLHGRFRHGGWRRYFLLGFLIKSTLPFLALVAWSLLDRMDRRKAFALLPAAVYLGFCSISGKQAYRYLLPAFPFLCLAVASLAERPGGRRRLALSLLVAACVLECGRIFPDDLAYCNQLVGGPSQGYRWMEDDSGQDLAKLGRFRRQAGEPEMILASHANGDREHYLGVRQDLLDDPAFEDLDFRHVNSSAPADEWLVVSAQALQAFGMGEATGLRWLLERRRPIAVVGNTQFVYDVTSDALAHDRLGWIYYRNGRARFALREFERAADLAPERAEPREGMRLARLELARAGAQK